MNYINLYNKLIKFNSKLKGERLYRKDYKYDFLIPIKYNWKKKVLGKGSAIFLHLAKGDFSPTSGCIALKKGCLFEILEKLNNTDKINIISN